MGCNITAARMAYMSFLFQAKWECCCSMNKGGTFVTVWSPLHHAPFQENLSSLLLLLHTITLVTRMHILISLPVIFIVNSVQCNSGLLTPVPHPQCQLVLGFREFDLILRKGCQDNSPFSAA